MIRISVAAYRFLVWARYPRSLRERFADQMVRDFEAWIGDEVARRGAAGMTSVWVRALRDLTRRLPAPIDVSRSRDVGAMGGYRESTTTWGEEDGMSMLGAGVFEDVRYAVRSLRREPRFVGLVVGMVSSGLALNVLAFSIVNAYLLRPLPFPDGERLVAVNTWGAVSWTEVSELFELAVSWDLDVFTITDGDRPQMVPGAWITSDFLEAYDVRAAVGRRFTADETGPGGSGVAMISDRLWRERFGADPAAIGRSFRAYMSDRPDESEVFTVVGVLPADFWYLNEYTDVLVPIRGERALYTGRLRPGVDVDHAEAYVARLAEGRMENAPPDFQVSVRSLQDQYVAGVRPTLAVLQVAVLLVLLIAWANAAVLVLVRATRREREMAVRRALGAGRLRLARQLVSEGLLLALLAGSLGTVVAASALGPIRGLVTARLGRSVPGGLEALSIDATVLALALGVTLLAGFAFGAVPLVITRLRSGAVALRGGARSGETKGRARARSAMVVAEVALSVALLSAAATMVRSAVHLQTRDLGFEPAGVLRGLVGLRAGSYPRPDDRIAFFDRFIQGVRALPGVEAAGLARTSPFSSRFSPRRFDAVEAGTSVDAARQMVGGGYFEALGVPLLEGRTFSDDDGHGSEPVAVVSERVARSLWPDADPIGRRVREVPREWAGEPTDQPSYRVVGVVGDAERELGGFEGGDVYTAVREGDPLWLNVLVRARPGAAPLVPALEGVLRQLDPEVPLSEVADLEALVEGTAAPTRFMAAVLASFSAFALALALVGLYGVVTYMVRERRRDIAIRMALGAGRGQVVGVFLMSGLAITALGAAIGSGGGLILGRSLEGLVFGVSPGDPVTILTLVSVLGAAALAATWIPARGAARAAPMQALKEE